MTSESEKILGDNKLSSRQPQRRSSKTGATSAEVQQPKIKLSAIADLEDVSSKQQTALSIETRSISIAPLLENYIRQYKLCIRPCVFGDAIRMIDVSGAKV